MAPVAPKHSNSKRESLDRKRARVLRARFSRILLSIILLTAMFVVGFMLRGNAALMAAVGFDVNDGKADVNPGMTTTGSTYDSISARVAEVEGILSTSSIDSYDLDQATDNLLTSFVATTSDPYLRYFSSSRYEAYVAETTATGYNGVGVLFAEYNGNAYAVDVYDNSSAALAGVRMNDFVVAINGDRSQAWTTTEVANALEANAGGSVIITWRRPASLEAEGGEEFTTTLAVSESKVTNVTSSMNGSVGYIKVRQFTQNSANLVSDAVDSLTKQGASALVLDIRSCPGGYLTQAVDIAGLFMTGGVVVQVQAKDGITTKTATGATANTLPLVVLVDGNTSAAAEVLAAALQDSSRATLVGATTQGKGSVQVVKALSFGGALRYTVAEYLSPLGHAINNVGVSPDVSVANSSGVDTQLSVALETANSLGAA